MICDYTNLDNLTMARRNYLCIGVQIGISMIGVIIIDQIIDARIWTWIIKRETHFRVEMIENIYAWV